MDTEQKQDAADIDFSGLILGFGSAALSYLGYQPDGSEDQKLRNLTLAKQNINIIDLLKEKTRGNLSDDEKNLIEQVLADLKMKYISVAKQ
jgi:hypothetical protein